MIQRLAYVFLTFITIALIGGCGTNLGRNLEKTIEMGRAKQLKVCINSKAKHTVVAKPDGCDEKTEKMQPPYDFPIYEFRFMLAECKGTPSPAPTPPTKPKKPKHSSQSS